MQSQQAEDNKSFLKQQKSDEKYHTKKALLTNRKDDVNRNIRDLGVLPEGAFEKYIYENLDKVSVSFKCLRLKLTSLPNTVGQETAKS